MKENITTQEESKIQRQGWEALANQKYIFFIKESRIYAFKFSDLNKAILDRKNGVEEMAQCISLEFMYPMESTIVSIFGANLEKLFDRILTFKGTGLQIEEDSDCAKLIL